MKTVTEIIKNLPLCPGVYLMKDRGGEILYIGKAREIRKRVESHFRNRGLTVKEIALTRRVTEIDYVETPTEVDALLLEAGLIKKYQPRFNKELKDDKSFPLLKITGDPFPMIQITRRRAEGPRGASALCEEDRKATYYGPFTDAKLLREAVRILNAIFPIRKCLRLPKAACLYYHLGQCLAPCIKPELKEEYDSAIAEVKEFIGGGKKTFIEYLTAKMEEAARDLRFEEAQFFKEQIEAIGKLKRRRYRRGNDISGVSLSATCELKGVLGLNRIPERIVCFDVSNVAGHNAVASRVSFYYEIPDKSEYRRYRIRTVTGINDYAMIQEAVERMCRGMKEGKELFVPDLIVIDGGRGHLNSAYEVLKREGFGELPIISIAKRLESIFTLSAREPIVLARDSRALRLIQKIRDEAHRFAITYYRRLHTKEMSLSRLDKIPGIGEKRKRRLLWHFGSLDRIKSASSEELAVIPGMNRRIAGKVLEVLKEKEGGV